MVRMTGSARDENSLSSPTGELLSSVVRRINGNRAKRTSGTESSPVTKSEPRPSNTPRNDRLLSTGDPEDEGLNVVGSEPAAPSNMGCLRYFELGHRPCFKTVSLARYLFSSVRLRI